MSSPNLRSTSTGHGTSTVDKPRFGSTKTVFLGVERRALSVSTLVPVTAPAFMKQAGFSRLVNTLRTHSSVHSCADLMAVISDELPISTASATDEASTICNSMYDEAFNIQNLKPCAFFDDLGNRVQQSVTFEAAIRPANLTFVNFSCTIDGSNIDPRIKQTPFDFNYSLRLPQTELLVDPPPVSVSAGKKNNDNRVNDEDNSDGNVNVNDSEDDGDGNESKSPLFSALMDSARATNQGLSSEELQEACMKFISSISPTKKDSVYISSPSAKRVLNFSTDHIDTTTVPGNDALSIMESIQSPKMKKLIQRNSGSTKNKKILQTSYYGSLGFVDSQRIFDTVFGTRPTLLQVSKFNGANSVSSTSSAVKKLHEYIEKCHFDVFVSICESDYVGVVDPASEQRATQEICKKISLLKQEYNSRNNNKRITLHPAQLFEEYLLLVPSLPENASAWSVILCRSFYDGLTQNLRERLDDDEFVLPDMTSLSTKRSQLQALRLVKEAASISYVKMESERKRFLQLIGGNSSNGTRQQSQMVAAYSTMYDDGNNLAQVNTSFPSQQHGSVHNFGGRQSNNSLAETTIQQHSDNSSGQRPVLPFKVGQDGNHYPYRLDDPNVISDYCVGFRGCYGCGKTNHWRFKEECELANDNEAKKRFWKNLWIHRPQTKTRPDTRQQQSRSNNDSHYQRSNNNTSSNLLTVPPLPPASIQSRPTQPSALRGFGRGMAATTPAWMTPSTRTRQREGEEDPNQPAPVRQRQLEHTDVAIRRENPGNPDGRMFVTTASLLQHTMPTPVQPMPLDLDNGLPGIVFRFGNVTDDNTPSWLCHLDSCAGMNTGNLALHQYIMTKYPHIVAEYIQCDDHNPFDPIRLVCAVPGVDNNDTKQGCLTAIVRYFTKYTYIDGSPLILSFGLGADITVNAIIGLPTLRQWGGDIVLSKNTFVAQKLRLEFPLDFKSANSFPIPESFNPVRDFVRPRAPKVVRIQCDNVHLNDTLINKNSQVIDSMVDGVLQRRVDPLQPQNRELLKQE